MPRPRSGATRVGLVGAVVGLTAAVVLLRGGGGGRRDGVVPTGRPRPSVTVTTAAPVPRSVHVPAGMHCRDAPTLVAGALPPASAAVCSGRDPSLRVELRIVEPALVRAYVDRLTRSVPGATVAFCRDRVTPWSTARAPAESVGGVRCGRSVAGAELVWSDNGGGVVGRAVRADGDLLRLVRWWDALP